MDIKEARALVGKVARSGVLDGDYFPLEGGLNTVDSPMSMKPGELIDCLNYEPRVLGGYQRFQGLERYDGGTPPSQMQALILFFDGGTPANYPTPPNYVVGGTSHLYAYCLALVLNPGSTTAGYMVICNGGFGTSLDFLNGETLHTASPTGPTVGTVVGYATANLTTIQWTGGTPANYPAIGAEIFGGTSGATAYVGQITVNTPNTSGSMLIASTTYPASSLYFAPGETLHITSSSGPAFGTDLVGFANTTLDTTYQQLAVQQRKSLIVPPPGSGPILGVVEYIGSVFAFRNSSDGTYANMWSATAAGWVQIPMKVILNFSAGSLVLVASDRPPQVNDFISNYGGGAFSALVLRVVLQSGSWTAGTAQGQFVVQLLSGTIQPPGYLGQQQVVSGTPNYVFTLGTNSTPVLLPNGSYDFRVANFFGASGSLSLYGCDGVNPAFEFNENGSFYQIESGMPVDTPNHIESHRGRLWLSFPGGSVQPSGANDPVVFSALQGAAELGVGFEVTGLLGEMSPSQSAFYSTATLFIFTPQQTFAITGDGPNWILGPFAVDTGAIEFTIQRIGQGTLLNDRGIATLQSEQQLGNFALATVSQKIQSLVPELLATATCSSISKNKSLYRLFIGDAVNGGRFISVGFRDLKVTGMTICYTGAIAQCAWSGNAADQSELLMIGGSNGYVYQLDSGMNQDGLALPCYLHTAFHFSKSPGRQKRYRRAQIDMICNGTTTIQFAPDYQYGAATVGSDAPRTLVTVGVPPNPGVYASFSWSNGQVATPTFKLDGSGTNAGFVIYCNPLYEQPHVIQGITIQKSMRRLDRSSNT